MHSCFLPYFFSCFDAFVCICMHVQCIFCALHWPRSHRSGARTVPLVRVAASAQGLLELRSEINTIVEKDQKKINEWFYFKLCESHLKKSRDFHRIHGVQRPCCFSFDSLRNSRTSRVSQVRPEVRKITQRPNQNTVIFEGQKSKQRIW